VDEGVASSPAKTRALTIRNRPSFFTIGYSFVYVVGQASNYLEEVCFHQAFTTYLTLQKSVSQLTAIKAS
jgi:hypothetical protein